MEQKKKFPRSQKVYLPGKLYPNIRVAMRKVEQVPSVSFEGEEKIEHRIRKYMYMIPADRSVMQK